MENDKIKIGMKRRLGFNFYDIFVTVFCVAFALICFYPMWYVLIASVMPYNDFIRAKFIVFIPLDHINFQYYATIFSTAVFKNSLMISFLKTILSTAITLIVTSSMAYAVSKTHIKGMKLINLLVVFNLFFTGGVIPEFMLYKEIGLLNTFWVLVLPGCLNITYFIIMRNYFSFSVSPELEEAARIDGCNDVIVFNRIILPLAKPMLAAVGLFVAVLSWNDYYSYMMFSSREPSLQTFAWVLHRMLVDTTMMNQMRSEAASMGMQLPPPIGLRMATIICAMLPIMVVYPFLQKYFAQGMMLGAVKE